MIILLCLGFVNFVYGAGDLCLEKYGNDIKKWSEWYFGIEYPYWYNVGLIKTESRCIWRRSLDGLGSVGVGQITPRFWDLELRKEGLEFYKIEGHEHHAGAIVYILKNVQRSLNKKCFVCKYCHIDSYDDVNKLWCMYQGYNRNIVKINKEIEKAGICNYILWREVCKEVDVCVWRNKDGSCKQWRNGCDINAEYSKKVYENGMFYRRLLGYEQDTLYVFW